MNRQKEARIDKDATDYVELKMTKLRNEGLKVQTIPVSSECVKKVTQAERSVHRKV